MANGDSLVPVNGPDGKLYHFPTGTTKESAVAYFKKKGIGAAPTQTPAVASPATPAKVESSAPSAPASPGHDSAFKVLSKTSEDAMTELGQMRPRWDKPGEFLKNPTWYNDATSKYLGGEVIGAGKAVAGGVIGGTKILSDLMMSLDPRELYHPTGAAQQVGSDIKGLGYGIGQMTKDLLLHFPETMQDPEKLGSDIMNMAMTVDGGVKGTHAVMDHLFPDPMANAQAAVTKTGQLTAKQKALYAASQASSGPAAKALRWESVKSQYLHKNGVGVAQDFVKAVKSAQAEDKVHTDNLAKIDTALPSGVIDATGEAKTITDAFKDIVQTPDPMKPALSSMVKDAAKVAPGQWTYVKTMQFRTALGRAMQNVQGPQYAVMARVYGDLTKKLATTAKKFGLEDSWNQHNELAAKMNKSFPLIEKAQQVIGEGGEGVGMAQALKNEAATKEVVKSLAKYGLDADKTIKYMTKSDKLLKEGEGANKSLRNYIYSARVSSIGGAAGAVAGYEGAHAAGMSGLPGYIAALGLGAATGWATQYLVNMLRASRLSPEILDSVTDSREWPGRLKPPSGKFPEASAEPTEGTPTGPKASPAPAAPKAPPSPVKVVDKPSAQVATMPVAEPSKPVAEAVEGGKDISNKAKAAQVVKETKAAEPKVTKVPEGEHGSGKLAREAKQRERVAKVRKEKGSTALGGGTQEISGGDVAGEISKAQAKVTADPLDISKFKTADLEQALLKMDKKNYNLLQSLRKKGVLTDEDYEKGLQSFVVLAYDAKNPSGE
jgi:hypothetical protein